jgi:hypothetical protein
VRAPVLLAVVAVRAWAAPGQTHVDEAVVFYEESEFEKCLQRVELGHAQALKTKDLARLELYAGLCTFGLGSSRSKEAEEHFRIALKLDPTLQLPPLTSPKVKEHFEAVRGALPPRPVLEPAPASPPSPAPVELEATARSGVPRFVPLVLGGVAVAAGGTGGYFGFDARRWEAQANAAEWDDDFARAARLGQDSAVRANVLYAVAGAFAVAALITFLLGP